MNSVKKSLRFLDNNSIRIPIIVILLLYVGLVVPFLSYPQLKTFENIFVDALIVLVIIIVAIKDPLVALIIAVALVASLIVLYCRKQVTNNTVPVVMPKQEQVIVRNE